MKQLDINEEIETNDLKDLTPYIFSYTAILTTLLEIINKDLKDIDNTDDINKQLTELAKLELRK